MAKPPSPGRPGGKPPKEHQFKPGQSGNPGGRPKKQPALRELSVKWMSEPVSSLSESQPETVGEWLARRLIAFASQNAGDLMKFARWLEGDQPLLVVIEDADETSISSETDAAIIQGALDRQRRRQVQADRPAAGPPPGSQDDKG